MLIIQVVEILWTKATRGAPRAHERVSLPRAFPFSAGDQPCVIQRYQMSEWKDFAPLLLEQKEPELLQGQSFVPIH